MKGKTKWRFFGHSSAEKKERVKEIVGDEVLPKEASQHSFPFPYSSISPEWKEGLSSSSSSSFPLSFKFTPIPQLTQKRPPDITQLVVRTALYTRGELRKKFCLGCIFNLWGTKINPSPSPLEQVNVEEHVLALVHHSHGLGGEEDVPHLPRGGAEDHDWGEKDKKKVIER